MQLREEITQRGFVVLPSVVDDATCDDLVEDLERVCQRGRGGIRNVLSMSCPARLLVRTRQIRDVIESVLSPGAFCVPVLCAGARGSGVLMRPLLFHASAKAANDAPRRILHLEFADQDLPHGLEWTKRV